MQSGTFDELPIGKTVENGEFTAERMMSVQLDHQKQSQNLDNNFTSVENSTNIIIKQENYKNGDFGANFPLFQMPTTSSALDVENEGNELIGLEGEEFADEDGGRTIFADEMDLDEEEMKGTSENEGYGNIVDGQIECAPVKIGTILKCNWPTGCEYRTKRLRDMQRHWRVHTGERPYVCAECGRPFADATTFERHKLTHTDKRPYICAECGQSFARPDTLKNHQLIHTGEKPYQCDVCGQSFRQSSGLRNHRRTHTGERPYICEECGQSFKQSSSLKDHKRMHNKRWNNNRKN